MNRSKMKEEENFTGLEIAIIGMAGRFPGANNVDAFWDNLKNGIDSGYLYSNEELLEAGEDKDLIDHPDYVKTGRYIEGKEYFDSNFFGYLPAEASIIDPQVRMFHECVWEALEDSGYDPEAYDGLIGLYAGAGDGFLWQVYSTFMNGHSDSSVDPFTANQLRKRDFMATLVSYRLNLKGPAVFIHAACSTSLVAIHMACRGLLTGESHIALAGGVSLSNYSNRGYLYREGMILASDGCCRAFDAEAKGTVGGEGAAVVVLKRLKKAIADRDNILAIVKGTAINNDGLRKIGFSAPSEDGQADIIAMAQKMARVEPQSISYIEAHGTGTVLGDPIEMGALTQVFGKSKEKYCAVGSVKTNIGHLDTAAGVASFIKTVLALKHRLIPPSLHFEIPNPRIDFENSPFYVNTELKEWRSGKYPLRAGVSSFGIGGNNAHVVLEERPECIERKAQSAGRPQLILLSAKTGSALDKTRENVARYLKKNPGINLADAAYTLQVGRRRFPYRSKLLSSGAPETIEKLSSLDSRDVQSYLAVGEESKNIIFMFPGLGPQYVNMGSKLYQGESVFREEMDRCFDTLKDLVKEDIKKILYPPHPAPVKGTGGDSSSQQGSRGDRIHRFEIAQLVIFIFEYALAKLLIHWGIKPRAMMGYSFGEYVIACLSGVLTREDMLRLLVARGKLISELPPGMMLSVPLPVEDVHPLLPDELSIGIDNGPSCVVSGPLPAIKLFAKEMKEKKLLCTPLESTHGVHSQMMDPILKRFEEDIGKIPLKPPQIPYISTVSGNWIRIEDAVSPAYWAKQLRSTVCFAGGIQKLLNESNSIFLEVGPGRDISALVNRQINDCSPHQAGQYAGHRVVNLVRHRHNKKEITDEYYLLDKIALLWLYGANIDWQAFHSGEEPQRISLPTYPFEKIKYPFKVDINKLVSETGLQHPAPGNLQIQARLDDWNNWQGTGTTADETPAKVERVSISTPYREPATPTERKLVEMWGQFFNIEKIGIDDDFYELGGDSLKAMNIAAKIHQRMNVEVLVTDFFACPTIESLARRIDSSIKKEFVSIEPVEEKEYYTVSSAQKRLYFHFHMGVHSTAYNLIQTYTLAGEIDTYKLEDTFSKLIQRHESLRTSFHMSHGEPVQRIAEDKNCKLQITNYKQIPDPRLQIPGIIETFVQPFDLSQPSLLRIGLIEITEKNYLLLIDMHHIITDGTSQGILTAEFMRLYAGIELPGLKVRYRDYAEWQQRNYQTGEIEKQEAYWLKQFAGDIPLLDLPVDYPRPDPGSRTYEGVRVAFQIDKETLEKINRLVLAEGVTLFIVLLTVYNILLSRYTGKEDIVVGTGSAGRRHTDLAGIIGIFIHVLPMRNLPLNNKPFLQFLREVKTNALDAYENEDYPFEELVKALNIQGKTPLNPLFDAAFELINMEHLAYDPTESGPGLTTNVDESPQPARYDITIYTVQTPDHVEMLMVCPGQLFKPSTVKKMAEHYLEILNQVLSNVNIEISGIDILTEEEKEQLLFEFNRFSADGAFPADYPGDKRIQQVFEEQVEKTPHALAVVYRDRQLTYRQLNERANMLAHLLRSKGVTADTLVALMVDPSIETTLGIFGILKAGGAYLPIHHETPSERFLSILKDSRVSLVLTKTGILRSRSFSALQGLRRQEMKPYKTQPRTHITDFDGIPFPDRSLVNYEKYNRYIGHNLIQDCISLQATRGCPFNCAYCHKIWPKKHVARSAENVFAEVLFNYNLGIRRFSFVDDIFNFNRENSRRFFELIIQHRLDLHLFFLMRGDILSEKYIDLMVEAGLVRLALALETASPRLQKLIGKRLNIDKLRANIEYIVEKYPQVILELYTMHGFPSETREEAMMTMNFIKGTKWLHFPYIFILTIFPNTDMEKLALDNGIPAEAIGRSLDLAFHELPDTLPFEKDFTIKYQAELLNDYFLSKERLLHVLPLQMKILTESEMVQKYHTYLPIHIESFDQLLEFFNLRREELAVKECMDQKQVFAPGLNAKFKAAFPAVKPAENALRLLLLDLSQNFSTVHSQLDDLVEPPLGLMYLMTYLTHRYKEKINGKIAKSMIDFDSFAELKALIEDLQPQVIGIRTLSLYHDFFHETVQKIRHWGITAPILTGGPYATSSYHTLLQDPNIDLVVLGEGEITLAELVGKILENNGKLPPEEELKEIAGIVFIPGCEKKPGKYAREIITLDDFIPDHDRSCRDAGALPDRRKENPEPVNQPHHLAYAIYTSGSTGLPKGVMLEQRHLSRLIYGLKERIYSRYNHPLNIGLVAPYVFDASVKQIFAALVRGDVLHIVADEVRVDGPALLRFYNDHCIDVSDGTPALIRLLLETLNQVKAESGFPVKHLIIGGEALPGEKVRELFLRVKENLPAITNVYGPTECTVDSASFEVTVQSLENYDEIPIGKPMPFDFIYILDRGGGPVPIGVPGELCIGGFKVARGYLNKPELTAEKFIEYRSYTTYRPYISSKIIYKTGDLVRWLSDGNIEFLGRIDQQVKIRGFRIEPGEIENRLLEIEEIPESVVIPREVGKGEKYLCAYIVTAGEIDISGLRHRLSATLPNYMIPSYFIPVEKIPLTPNGKIDRKRLPVPEIVPGADYAGPRDEIEERMVDMWSDVLEIEKEKIGVTANFFELGGHSLKATTLLARIHKVFNTRVPLETIFRRPTIRSMAEYVSGASKAPFISISPVEKRKYYGLSSAQKRLFIIQQMETAGVGYNIPLTMLLEGELDKKHLEGIIRKLIKRHESLRTSFAMINREPVQEVHEDVEFEVDYSDLAAKNAKDREEIMKNFIRSFDLSKAPLLRVGLFRVDKHQHVLILDMHHIITDGSSTAVLAKEFMDLYAGKELKPLRIQYKDFARWQKIQQENKGMKKQEEYWLNVFMSGVPVLNLPLDYPRPAVQSFEGHRIGFVLERENTGQLRELAANHGATLYMILMAIFNVLLAKLSGQEDIVVGTPVAGRRHAELEPIIGMFVNTLALRHFPSPRKSFIDFLKEVKNQTLEAFENQEYQFEDLVEQVPVNRDMGRNPIFDVMFVLQNLDIPELAIPGLTLRPYESETKVAKFDLTLTGGESQEDLGFSLEYCTKLFKKETIERFIEYSKKAISEIIKNPGKQLAEIEIISDTEKNRILFDFNNTEVEYPAAKTIHELFEEQAAKTPDGAAVIGVEHRAESVEQLQLTYGELDKKSNQLGYHLRANGVGPDNIVGIMVERSIEMIIGILGILKAGSAYLPIDPEYPQERIDYMLKDSEAGVLVSEVSELSKESEGIEVVKISELSEKLPTHFTHLTHPTHLCYIIYTSGSTGRPKGVMVEHPSVVNILSALQAAYPLNLSDTYLFKTSYTFDVSAAELFGWFWNGGRMAMLEPGAEKDPNKIIETIEQQCVTHINFVPSMFSVFMEHVAQPGRETIARLSSLKYIFLAGEALLPDLVEGFRRLDTGITAENIYGPTEAAVYSSWYSLAHWDGNGGIPIGKPMPNIRLYILDKTGSLQPIGIPGELFIAGAGIARGYLNNPELTAEKFIEYRPYKSYRTYIFYKTGDLARWLPDRNIEFIGRIDQQVKIRGFRIETGEIENRLLAHDLVKSALVIAREQMGDRYLCAYIIREKPFDLSELKDFLSKSVPGYMVPAYFVEIDELPLTPSGKLDRKALPGPEFKAGEYHEAPGNPVEEKLAEIWSDVLGIDKEAIGIRRSFFDSGGHSLKATILITRIHQVFNVKVTLVDIFRQPFIRGLAELIKAAGGDIFVPIEPIEKKEYYPLSSAQERIYILQRMIKDNISYNNPAFVTLEGDLHKETFEETLQQLINRHETLRTSVEMLNAQAVQKVHANVMFALEYNEIAEEEVEKRILRFIRPFDLSRPPLMRVELIKTGEKQHIVMYDLHHIITDGTSMQVFIREFLALYAGNQLPPLKVQYKDFSGWQNRLFESGEVCKQQEYWRKQFEGEIPVLNFPTDFPRPEIQRFEGDAVRFEIGSETTRVLNKLAKEQNATLYMVLLAIYNVLLSKLCGQEDIIMGTSIAGRRHADLHFIIGMFVNTLVMRNYPAGPKTFKEFLDEVKERTLAAFENQDYPFEELVDQIAVNRDTSRNPLFDVMFVLQNMGVPSDIIPESQIPALKTAPYQPKTQPKLNTAKFDMTLVAVESDHHLLFIYEYSTPLFKRETIEGLITYFKRIADVISEHAEKKISEIEIISPEEKNRLLKEFNQTGFPYPKDKTIHELFIEQTKTTPDHIAIVGAQGTVPLPGDHVSITYNELNEKSNQLAHHLRRKGVGPETIAAIMVERSIELIIGILGILKAGGAYLPIDPDSPQDRIDYMLKDSNTALLLTSEELADVGRGTNFCAPTTCNLHLSLAYIIYTSGTTGRPKGVLIHHRGVVNMVWFHRKVFKENPRSRISQAASAVFDAMAFEIWPCLLGGAALYIVDNETRMHPRRLKEWIIGQQITISFQPTRMAQELLEEQWPETGTALEVLRTAGERLSRYPTRHYPFRFYNLYGPTEDTVWSTWVEIPMVNTAERLNPPPIGKPAANKQVFILSSDLKLQPMGVVGELCISGDGLACGYLNNPGLTAERFITHHSSLIIHRFYRTGDLARWLADGNIEFFGRIDQQVKIRGFRIEPGEIQDRLLAYDLVKSSVVVTMEEGGETYLCAYIVTKETFDLSGLKDFLSKSVPEYMIPAYFVEIDIIPLTPSGKVDRKALPEPEVKSGEAYVVPGDDVEEKLTGIWADVLGLEKEEIGINDDFFRIGGHSLKAAAIISGIQKEFNIDVPLIEIFRIPTIKQLARYIRENETEGFLVRDKNLTLLKKEAPDARHLFLVHDGSGEVEGYIEFCRALNNGFNCWGIRADRNENYSPKNLKVEEIAGKYIEKIKTLQPGGPYFIAGWSLGGTIAFEMVNQLEQRGEGIGFFALIDSPPPRQANSQRDVQRFTLDTEKQFVSRYLSRQESEKIAESVTGIDDFWAHILDYLGAEQFNAQLIRQVVREYEAHVVPNYQGLGIGQLVRYLNTGRTFQNARVMYTPSRKIHTPVHYFAARQSEGIIANDYWNEHCREPMKIYEITGDHYSMFAKPNVLHFAEFFGNVLVD